MATKKAAATRARDLTEEQNKALRPVLRELLKTRWKGNQSAAARDLGVTPGAISGILSERQGFGRATAGLVLEMARMTPASIGLGPAPATGEVDPPALSQLRQHPSTASWRDETWASLRGAATASKEAMTPADMFALGNSIEAHFRSKAFATIVEDDPVEAARASRAKARGRKT